MSKRYGGGGLGVIQSFWNKGPTLATFMPKKYYKSEILKGDILRSYVNNRSNLAKNFSMLYTPSCSLQLGMWQSILYILLICSVVRLFSAALPVIIYTPIFFK